MVRTVRPKASATPSRPIPTSGNAAAKTALPHPPSTSQNVPTNSAPYCFISASIPWTTPSARRKRSSLPAAGDDPGLPGHRHLARLRRERLPHARRVVGMDLRQVPELPLHDRGGHTLHRVREV